MTGQPNPGEVFEIVFWLIFFAGLSARCGEIGCFH